MEKKNNFQVILVVIFAGLVIIGGFYFARSFFIKKEPSNIISASGRIEGDEFNAASKINAKVEKIFISEGDMVKQGQIIAQLSSKQIQAQLASAEKDIDLCRNKLAQADIAYSQVKTYANANINQANANLEKAKANFLYNEKEYVRYKNLYKEDAVSKARYDAAHVQYISAKQEYEFARNELEKMLASSADVEQRAQEVKISKDILAKTEDTRMSALADLEDTKIYSPADGMIVSKIVEEGDVISAGTPVVTIINPAKLYLRIFLPTEKMGKLKIGNPAKITFDALSNETFDAVVYKISNRAEFTPKNVETKEQRAKLVFEVKIKIKDNSQRKVKPGMPAEVKIDIGKN